MSTTIDAVSARAIIRAARDDISTIPYLPHVNVSGYRLFVLSVSDEIPGPIIEKLQRIAGMWNDLKDSALNDLTALKDSALNVANASNEQKFYNNVASKLKNQRFHAKNLRRKTAAKRIQTAWRQFIFQKRSAAAKRIQRAWRSAWYNPKHSLCRARLIREFSELSCFQK